VTVSPFRGVPRAAKWAAPNDNDLDRLIRMFALLLPRGLRAEEAS
jgi:hypothetical protein